MSNKEKLYFLKEYRELDDAYADLQVYSPYQSKDLKQDYHIDEQTIEEYNGKFNNVKEELRKTNDGDDPAVNIAINYDLRCYHIDQIDEDYILKRMEATRSDESAFIMEATGTNQKLIKEINEEILRFRKTNPERAKILDDMWHEYQDTPGHFINKNFTDALNERINTRIKGLIDGFATEWCINPEALEFFMETYDVTKDPSEKQDNQDALKKAAHPKEYRKDHPHIGLKYWPKLLDSLREFYVQHLQKLLER